MKRFHDHGSLRGQVDVKFCEVNRIIPVTGNPVLSCRISFQQFSILVFVLIPLLSEGQAGEVCEPTGKYYGLDIGEGLNRLQRFNK